ncbi:GAF domain-containing protein [Nafulsella turpanensis]|uniref:GAF domain-containing protein n=1 Tax=Nafulsella turpanensis TaxID=1265690 RepID=UPI000347572B|nr:GAF domain-containing protein [Nafulsella turpanensis]
MENKFGIRIIPNNEKERLAKLESYNNLDRVQEGGPFTHIAAMASQVFKVPIALVSFVGKERVLFKGNVGMEGTDGAGRGESLCSVAILQDEVTVFKNASEEACLLAHPLVTGSFGFKFYAGAPLITSDGFNIGTVCIIDRKPREFSEDDRYLLESLATIVMDELEESRYPKSLAL